VKVKVFVSYSHRDSRYVDSGEYSLVEYLKGLEQEDVEFWTDRSLVSGENWDEKIKSRIRDTDIALVLVSQAFLDSAYCAATEVRGFLERCKDGGLVIFPVILSPCEWERFAWLKSRQFLPINGETIEENYISAGNRKRLYHNIRQDLRKCIDGIRESRRAGVTARPSDTAQETPSETRSPAIMLEAAGYRSLISILHDRNLSLDRRTELYVSFYLLEEQFRGRSQNIPIFFSRLDGSAVMADEDAERQALWRKEASKAREGGAFEIEIESIWMIGPSESVRQRFPRLAQLSDIWRKIVDWHSERDRETSRIINSMFRPDA